MKKILVLLITIAMTITLSGAAAASEQVTLTYQQAIDMALANSKTLKNVAADVDRSFEIRQDAGKEVKITPLEPGDPGVVGTYLGSIKADLAWQMSKRTLEISRDTVAYSVKQTYNAVILAEKKKKVADLAVENAYWQNRLAELKYQNGMASLLERMQANSGYSGAKESQDAAAKALNDAYQKFNNLVGLSPEARPKLTEQPVLDKMKEINLENKISQVTSDSYTVWLADQKINLARLDLDLYSSRTSSEPYSAKAIDLKKAENTATDARSSLDKLVRTLYYTIKQLEDSYSALQAKMGVAEQGYKLAQVKYDIGMTIKAEVISSQLELEQLKQQMLEISINHANQMYVFEKPWVYSGASQ
ncbi:MAG: TolC family protein [Bacillota bacterium]